MHSMELVKKLAMIPNQRPAKAAFCGRDGENTRSASAKGSNKECALDEKESRLAS